MQLIMGSLVTTVWCMLNLPQRISCQNDLTILVLLASPIRQWSNFVDIVDDVQSVSFEDDVVRLVNLPLFKSHFCSQCFCCIGSIRVPLSDPGYFNHGIGVPNDHSRVGDTISIRNIEVDFDPSQGRCRPSTWLVDQSSLTLPKDRRLPIRGSQPIDVIKISMPWWRLFSQSEFVAQLPCHLHANRSKVENFLPHIQGNST